MTEVKTPAFYKHHRRPGVYKALCLAKNCNNDSDGEKTVVYVCVDDANSEIFTRKVSEFLQKFTEIT